MAALGINGEDFMTYRTVTVRALLFAGAAFLALPAQAQDQEQVAAEANEQAEAPADSCHFHTSGSITGL